MSEWTYIDANSFCTKVTDGTHDSPKRKNVGRYLITSKHIKGRTVDFDNAYLISDEDYNKINERSKVDQWDVLISMIGEYCGFCYIERNQTINYAVKNIGIFKTGSKIKADWIYYYLNSPEGKGSLASLKSGTSQPYLSLGSLRTLPILTPKNNKEMETIIPILSSLDDKIDLLNRQNKTLEALAETCFTQWFVEADEGDWEKGTLGDICERITKGTTPTTIKRQFVSTGINFIKVESINEFGNFIPDKFAFIDEKTHQLLSRSIIQENDILYTIAGTIGRTAVVNSDILPANTNQAVAIIRLKNKSTFLYYIRLLLKTSGMTNDLSSKIVHSVQPNLSLGEISATGLSIPPEAILTQFNEICQPIFEKMKHNTEQIRTLHALRDTLLPKLISGELRVKM